MAYDIFHNYGFEKSKIVKPLTESINHQAYAEADRLMDQHKRDLQSQYLEGNKSPAEILLSFGYKETPYNEHRYEMEHNEFTLVFDFTSFDWDDGPIIYYTLDSTGNIPDGYCQTKFELQEPTMDWKNEGCELPDFPERDRDFLTASIESKYDINDENSEILTEAFNNLPRWLVDFLNNHHDGKSVKRMLSNRGIDLANVSYTRAPFPRSNRDPVLKDPNRLNIFRLENRNNEQIYIPNYNNPFLYYGGASSWNYRYANECPMKAILDMTIEYGYIDLTNNANLNRDIRRQRAELKKDVVNRGVGQYPSKRSIYDDSYNVIGTETTWLTTPGQDKSGYPLNPDKYVKMLDNVGLDTYSDRLQQYYDKIEHLRVRIIACMNKFNTSNSLSVRAGAFGEDAFECLSDATRCLGKAINYYQRLKDSIDNIINHDGADDPEYPIDRQIHQAFVWEGGSLRELLNDAIKIVRELESFKFE